MTLRWRGIWVALLAVTMAYLALPSFFSDEERLASGWIRDEGLNLGLDLQGGIHWLLRIDTDTAVRQEMQRVQSVLRERLAETDRSHVEVRLLDSNELEVSNASADVNKLIEAEFESIQIVQREGALRLVLTDEWNKEVVRRGVRQALEVLRKRVDGLGVREPVIAPQGEERILVQMPGEIDPRRARSILEETTFLEFNLVLDVAPNEELLNAQYPEGIDDDKQLVVARNDDESVSSAYLVPKTPVLTGAMLEDARLGYDRRNRPVVFFRWNSQGTAIFREFTANNIDRQLAIIVDGEILSAPVIQSRIGRDGQIEGQFTAQEAADLAVALRSGALPIPLVIEEERSVGPALGADSIQKGLRSILIGGAFVLAFMVVYYQTSGLLANLALLLNLVQNRAYQARH